MKSETKKNKLTNNNMRVYKSPMPELSLKYRAGEFKKVQCATSHEVFTVLRDMYDQDTVEYNESMIILFLNGMNKTIGWTKHSSGGTAQTVVDVKMILSEALLCGASAIIISHNHPSGQMQPSREDTTITEKIKRGCEAVTVRLLDHIIVSGDLKHYYSFADEGKL